MKNSEEHIDILFRDNLGNQSFDIPDDFIDSLNKELDKMEPKKNKKEIFIFYSLNSLFLIIFLTLSFTSSVLDKKHTLVSSHKNTNIPISLGEEKAKSNSKNYDLNRNLKQVLATDNDHQGEVNKDTQYPVTEYNGSNNSKNTDVEIINTQLENDPKNSLNNPKGEKKERFNSNQSKISSKTKSKELPSMNENDKLIQQAVQVSQESIANENNSDVVNTNGTNISNVKSSPTDSVKTSEKSKITDTTTIVNTTDENDTTAVENTIQNNEKTNILQVNSKELKFETQAFGGFNYGAQYFSTSSQLNSTYDLKESPILSPSFGFNVNATLKKVSLGTGIEYFKTGEEIDLNTTNYFQNQSIEIVDYMADSIIFDSLTQTWDTTYIAIYDTVTVFDTITSSETWINTYSWISIPLNVGYRFDYGKWAIIPKAGMTFNFGLRNSNGQYYISNGKNNELSSSAPVKFNLDYLLQIELRRSINKFELYLSPSLRGNLTPMLSDSPVRKYKSIAVRLGVAYQF